MFLSQGRGVGEKGKLMGAGDFVAPWRGVWLFDRFT